MFQDKLSLSKHRALDVQRVDADGTPREVSEFIE